MIRLSTLGEIDLRLPDGERVDSVLQQPGQFALLVYLALAGGSTVRRDTLLGLFWPESPEDRARHRLAQAVYRLRRALGKDVIHGRGTRGYGVSTEHLSCDAAEFLRAFEHEEFEQALDLYAGDFLPAFFAENGRGFERWMEERRTALRRAATRAALELASARVDTEPVGAAATARRALELSDADEPTVRQVIQLLDRAGDRVGALEAFDQLRERLEYDFGADPSPETLELVRGLREPGPDPDSADAAARSSLVPEAPRLAEVSVLDRSGSDGLGASRSRWGQPLRWRWPLAASLAGLVAAGILLQSWATPAVSSHPPRVFVETVENHAGPESGMDLSRAVTTETLARLAEIASFEVLPHDPTRDPSAVPGPAVILRTDLTRSGDTFRVTALLLDAESRVTVGKGTSEHPVTEDLEAVDAMSAWLARFARERAGSWLKDRKMYGSGASEATLDLVRSAMADRARADSLIRRGSLDAATTLFGIADSVLVRAEAEAPSWAEPSIQRAETALSEMWVGLLPGGGGAASARAAVSRGLGHADRAVRISPGDLDALSVQATLSHWLWVTTPSDSVDEGFEARRTAEGRLRHVVDLDPTRARAWADLSALLQARGAWAEARWAAERAFRADAYLDATGAVTARLFETSLETGDLPAARQWCERLAEQGRGNGLYAYCRLSLLAWNADIGSDQVETLAAILDDQPSDVLNHPIWGPRLDALSAVVLARAGMPDRAQAALDAGTLRAQDPDFVLLEAWALVHLGQADSARRLLEGYVLERPHNRSGALESRRFRELSLEVELVAGAGPPAR